MDAIITRHKHDIRRRLLTVCAVEKLTPHMIRITLAGDDLIDFVSLSPDDHIKLFFPDANGEKVMRDYTPRRFSSTELVLDFAIHEAGPATLWAKEAKVGDTLAIGGPRGSAVVSAPVDWWLLIADETALPALGRRLEELPAGVKVITLTAIPDEADRQVIETKAQHEEHWVIRPEEEATNPASLLAALAKIQLPKEGNGFIWIAAEAQVARALRSYAQDELNHPPQWMKAAGYWTKGLADTPDKSLE